MKLDVRYDCATVDWSIVSGMLKSVGMAYHEPDVHKRAFEACHTTVFVYQAETLVGFGRALSDGEYQAAIYDVAVHPAAQGNGIGKLIIQSILKRIPNCNVILYASPGKEGFYQKLGFRKMKTGMALFKNSTGMATKGFTE
jgi:ribosomal protein S18 acetylase RimI-like enzyme